MPVGKEEVARIEKSAGQHGQEWPWYVRAAPGGAWPFLAVKDIGLSARQRQKGELVK